MYCYNCGKEIQNSSTFCPFCGQKTSKGQPDNIFTSHKRWIYIFLCWIVLNTILYLLIGDSHSDDFLYGYKDVSYNYNTFLICTFLAPLLYWIFRKGTISLLKIHPTNRTKIKISSIIIGIIPVFFLCVPLSIVLGGIFEIYSSSVLTLNFILSIIFVEFFFRDLFK